ncbi:transposase [Actinospica durhamensis]|uniref:Transposase n=1 Tax=Actinospica durhamensis TaxID=1508375 RepID=A0A941ISD6_9ACTN|nr:transposase [Actinospica durhamensis]
MLDVRRAEYTATPVPGRPEQRRLGSRGRASNRTAFRNGHRDKTLTTQVGDLDLSIPKLRSGSFFPVLTAFRTRPLDHVRFPSSTSTRPTARPGSSTRSTPGPWSSPPELPRTAAARCSA